MKLIVAEKPSVAAQIAAVVGATSKKPGFIHGNDYIVTWCFGHLIELATPEEYAPELKVWSLTTLPIIPDNYKTSVTAATAAQYKIIKSLVNDKSVTELIEATDAGREGELIFRLVYEKLGCKKPCKRLWINSLEEKSIAEGLQNMRPMSEYDTLYKSAYCRQRADWLVGINFTRAYTKMNNEKLRVGRVQTPTLKMILDRDMEIEQFKAETYYNIIADMGSFKAKTTARTEAEAQEIKTRCAGNVGYVVSVDKNDVTERAPELYDITSIQRDANKQFGYTAKQTLDLVQSLYEKKLVTYPRTDSRYITEDMAATAESVIKTMCGYFGIEPINANVAQIVNNKKVSDHHAIIPTLSYNSAAVGELPTSERQIYNLIAKRLIVSTMEPHRYEQTKVVIDIEGELFSASGRIIKDAGYKKYDALFSAEPEQREKDEPEQEEAEENSKALPPMAEGNMFTALDITYKEAKTKPPKYYTDATLLSAMEHAGRNIDDAELKEAISSGGLGTPATRAGIIESLIASGYVVRNKRNLITTHIARLYVPKFSEELTSAEMTARWELALEEIRAGKRSPESFMKAISDDVRQKVEKYKYMVESGIVEVPAKRPSASSVISVCPRCGKDVVEHNQNYACTAPKGTCDFVIWKKIAGKNITAAQAKKLCEKGRTDTINGFEGKKGKYNARLRYDKDAQKIVFDFS
ncbi:MAG: DNA topoisomerase 3 [Eubacteriales bacterium]|nr:DNA topoisomerase 3 [Eubacteriales bacterium]